MKKDWLPQGDVHSYALKTKKGFRVLRKEKKIGCHRVMCTHMHGKQRKSLGFLRQRKKIGCHRVMCNSYELRKKEKV
jgi:hypothetical protein